MSGFGSGFGFIPFGGASGDGDDVLVLGLVQLAANLLGITAAGDADALLVTGNWTLTALDPEAHPRLVQSAQHVDSVNQGAFNLPQLVLVDLPITLLTIDGVLTYGKRYRLTFETQSADFTAMLVAASAAPADVRTSDGFIYDIANPYLTRDALVFPAQLGTYQVTETGDLGTDKSGEGGLRKRIVRRVLAAAGSYFHLAGYGVGVQLDALVSVDSLRRLSARIRAQVLQEPEVQSVKCSLSQVEGAPSVIRCTIEAQTDRGLVQAVVPIQLP